MSQHRDHGASSWWRKLWPRRVPERNPAAEAVAGVEAGGATDSAAESQRAKHLAASAQVASERDVAAIERQARELLSAGEPSAEKAVFCILKLEGEGLLTIEGGQTPALVVFSPPVRAFHYGKRAADLESRQLRPFPFALEDWPRLARACQDAGVGSFALNPPARGSVARIYSLDSAGGEEGLRDVWVTDQATQSVLFERRFREAERAYERGDRRNCLQVCQEIVQHIDDLRPEVYVLLGQCALVDGDTAMLSYSYERLLEFDEPWRTKLRRFASEHAAGDPEGTETTDSR